MKPGDLYEVGCSAYILKMLKMPNNSIRLLIQGVARIRLTEFTQEEPFIRAKVTALQDHGEKTTESQALLVGVKGIFQKYVEMAPNLPAELAIMSMNLEDPGILADLIASSLNLSLEDKQSILEILDVNQRLEKVNILLNKELSVMELGSKIQSQVREGMEKTQREYFLREQLKAIQKELGEKDERTAEIEDLRQRLDPGETAPGGDERGGAGTGPPGEDAPASGRIHGRPHFPRLAHRSSLVRFHRGQPGYPPGPKGAG